MKDKEKIIPIRERWQSDLKGQYEMKQEERPFNPTKEQIEKYKKYGVDLVKIQNKLNKG